MKRVLCWVGIALAVTLAAAQAAAPARAQKAVQLNQTVAAIEALNVPGGVIGVTGDGIGPYTRAFGVAAPGVPMTESSELSLMSDANWPTSAGRIWRMACGKMTCR